MKDVEMFMSVEAAAKAIGYNAQTVRNRIADGSLRAIQGAPGGAYRVPKMEVEAFKRRHGMSPARRTAVPTGVRYVDAELIYEEELAPVVQELRVKTPEDALRYLREHPRELPRFADFVISYTNYMRTLSDQVPG
jgi:excisionase family DNA binding protein